MSNDAWFYANADRERHGPLPAERLRELYAAGDIGPRTLVWCQGMPQWQPLNEAADALGLSMDAPPATLTPPQPDAPQLSAAAEEPVQPAPPAPRSAPSDGLQAAYAASIHDAEAISRGTNDDVVDAGFVRRFAAYMVDAILIAIAMYSLIFLMLIVFGFGVAGIATIFEASATGGAPSGGLLAIFIIGFYVLPFLMQGAYHIIFTGSAWQATPGKRVLGIKVVDFDGQRISTGRSVGRWFAAALSYLTFYIGFLMAAFTDRKMALHDMVASTRVVDQWAYTANPERQQRGVGGCAIAILVAGILFFGLFTVGIIAAISLPAYQGYTQRAQLTQVVTEARSMTVGLEEFRQNTDRCATSLEEAGVFTPNSAMIESASVGEQDDGRCTLQITLGGASAGIFNGEYLWFIREDAGNWTCGGSMDDSHLPIPCRG